MKAILPSAGYATRMHPLTLDKPKALLEVSGKPIIEYIIEKIFLISDVNEIIIVANNRFFNKFSSWSRNFKCRLPIKVINDGTRSNEERLGSIGDVYFALEKEKFDEDFLVINSDNLFSFDLAKIYENFILKKSCVISMFDVGSLEIARRMGNPRVDENNKIIFFKEKDKDAVSTLCSIGIYFFNRSVINLVKKYLDEGNSADRSGDFIEWLYKRMDVYGHIFSSADDKWFDIGSLESYEEAKRVWGNISFTRSED